MLRSSGWSRTTVVALAVLLTACSSGGADGTGISRDAFTEAMQDRFGIDAARAECITTYVFEDYDPAEVLVLADGGMAALPQARWEPYLNASAACITHDEPLPGVP